MPLSSSRDLGAPPPLAPSAQTRARVKAAGQGRVKVAAPSCADTRPLSQQAECLARTSPKPHTRPGSCLAMSSRVPFLTGPGWTVAASLSDEGPSRLVQRPLRSPCAPRLQTCTSARMRAVTRGADTQGKLSGNGIRSLEQDQMADLTQPDLRCRSCSRGARLTAGQVSPLPGWVTEARARPH